MTVRFHCLTGKSGGASTQRHELVLTSGFRLRGSAQKEQASQSRAQRSMQSEGKLQGHQTSAFDFKSHRKNNPYSPEKLDPPGIQRTALKELPQQWDLNMQLLQFLEFRAVCLTVQPSSTCDGCHLLLVVIWRPDIAQILNIIHITSKFKIRQKKNGMLVCIPYEINNILHDIWWIAVICKYFSMAFSMKNLKCFINCLYSPLTRRFDSVNVVLCCATTKQWSIVGTRLVKLKSDSLMVKTNRLKCASCLTITKLFVRKKNSACMTSLFIYF